MKTRGLLKTVKNLFPENVVEMFCYIRDPPYGTLR